MNLNKITNVIATIANLQDELSTQFTALAAEFNSDMVKAIPTAPATSDVPEVPKSSEISASGVTNTLGTTQDVPSAPIAEQTVQTSSESSQDLDDEGFPWDERIHVATKTKVKSKKVIGGQMWRLKQKCCPDLAKQVREEFTAANGVPAAPAANGVPAVPTANGVPAVPTVPSVPAAPAANGVPAVPSVPAAPAVPAVDYELIKQNTINLINKMCNDFGLTYDDLFGVIVDKFKVTQFDQLTNEQYQSVFDLFTEIFAKYEACHNLMLEIRQWGGDAYLTSIEEGFTSIFAGVNATTLGGVYHTDIDEVNETMTNYHTGWKESGIGQ